MLARPAHCPRGSHWRRGKCLRAVSLGEGWSSWSELFAERMRAVREEQDIAVSELAAAIGVWDETVHRWERGASTPSVQRLKQMADALGVLPSDLLPLGDE